MKIRYLTTVFFLSIFMLSACNTRKQAATQGTDSTAIAATPGSTTEVEITGRLADLGLTADTDWRGINLGDEFAKVKGLEKGEPFESDADHIGYTIELKNLESADMLYYQADNKVSAIDVDLFLNSQQSVTDFQKDLRAYFTARFGAPKPGDGGTVWSGSQEHAVSLKDVSKGKDFGLKIKMGDLPLPDKGLQITKHEWDKEVGAIAIHNLTIKNMSTTNSYKDVEVIFRYFGPSGTEINKRNETIYQIIKPGKAITVSGLNTGFVNQQATTCKVEIIRAKLY